MTERITTYDRETSLRILRELDALKRSPHRATFLDYPTQPQMITTRWARTCTTSDYPTYPTSGNVVAIEFGDYDFSPWYPGATATETFTAYDPQQTTFAYVESGAIPAEDTVVRVTWRNGKWCLFPESTGQPTGILWLGYCRSTNSPESEIRTETTTAGTTVVGYMHFAKGWGDLTGAGVEMMATNASVTATTHARTDPSFKLTQAGLYRFVIWIAHEEVTTLPAYTTATKTTSNASAGTAHTHTVDVREEHGFASSLRATLQWRNSDGTGSWTGEDYMAVTSSVYAYSSDMGTLNGQTDELVTCGVMYYQHDDPGRQFRIYLALGGDSDSSTGYVAHDVTNGSGLLAITRISDYAADQTLTV